MQNRLIDGLKQTLESSGLHVDIRETHISWVLLAGKHAWKIKKTVNFGFLDFSTLAKRKHACEEELRLNRRYAPDIYLRVVKIGGTVLQPVLDAQSAALEYAVCMRRFDESGLLSVLAETRQLKADHVDAVSSTLASLHQRAPVAGPNCEWGRADQVHYWLSETLGHIKSKLPETDSLERIERIEQRCTRLFKQAAPIMNTRNRGGFVRECHGDLHLGNMVWIRGKLVPFDCIEFNPALRWIDTISEAAFVMMDLQRRGYSGFAWRFINHYLSLSGDYAGLQLLHYYTVYRALVRAKVALLQSRETDIPGDRQTQLLAQYSVYTNLSERWLNRRHPALILMHGLSGSGKSTIAAILAERYGCIQLRSDVERKRLYGLDAATDSHSDTHTGIYTASASDKTYRHLGKLANTALKSGFAVIVDATFLQGSQREYFQHIADKLQCPFIIVDCEVDQKTLESRIIKRAKRGNDASEANLAVLQKQIEQQEPLAENEPRIDFGKTDPLLLPSDILNAWET